MSRRRFALLSLIVACPTLTACAAPATAPDGPTLTAGSLPVLEAKAPSTYRGGWVSSTGRRE